MSCKKTTQNNNDNKKCKRASCINVTECVNCFPARILNKANLNVSQWTLPAMQLRERWKNLCTQQALVRWTDDCIHRRGEVLPNISSTQNAWNTPTSLKVLHHIIVHDTLACNPLPPKEHIWAHSGRFLSPIVEVKKFVCTWNRAYVYESMCSFVCVFLYMVYIHVQILCK